MPRNPGSAARSGRVSGAPHHVWALGGGASKGSFEVGVLTYLSAHLDEYRPFAVCGTSVGALNAIPAAEATPEGLQKSLDAWLGLLTEDDMYAPEEWFRKLQKLDSFKGVELDDLISMKHLDAIGANIEADMHFAAYSLIIPFLGLPSLLEAGGRLKDIKKALKLFLETPAIFSLTPTWNRLGPFIDPSKIKTAGTKLRLVSVALEDGYIQAVTETGHLLRLLPDGGRSTERIINRPDLRYVLADGAMASAGIPAVFPPVVIETDSSKYTSVDGGVRDVIPLTHALDVIEHEYSGRRKPVILAVAASGSGDVDQKEIRGVYLRRDYSKEDWADLALRAVDVLTDEAKVNELALMNAQGRDFQVRLISPRYLVHSGMTIDPGLLLINIAYGYMTAFDVLTSTGDETRQTTLQDQTDRITQLRFRAWDLERKCKYLTPRQGVPPRLTWPKGVLQQIRKLKAQVRDEVSERVKSCGAESIPLQLNSPLSGNMNSFVDWWMEFERHRPGEGPEPYNIYGLANAPPFSRSRSPWEAYQGIGSALPAVPAANPPPRVVLPIEVGPLPRRP